MKGYDEMNNIPIDQKIILGLLGKNLFARDFELPNDVDWASVAKESRAQTVFSIVFNNYKELPLPEELAAKVKTALMKHTLSNVECFKNHTYLHEIMTRNGISYCAVKGAVSASYYSDPLMRAMGDVDFYVHPDDIATARAVFEKEGFTFDKSNHTHHIGMYQGGKHFEMHFKPVAYHDGWIGEIFDEYWSDIRATATLSESTLASYMAPTKFHHGFILLTHLQHHLFHEGVGLRHFCDWAVFVNSFSNDEFLSIFEARLKRIGLFRLARLLSLGAVKHLGIAHREWMGEDYDTADELLLDIMYGGNFGRKDRRRVYEGMLICDRGAGNVQSGRFSILVSSMNRMVNYNWRSAKKFPILYPIGWAYFSLRYLFRVITGKRKLNLIDNYRKSGERKDKYAKLRVFEPEK